MNQTTPKDHLLCAQEALDDHELLAQEFAAREIWLTAALDRLQERLRKHRFSIKEQVAGRISRRILLEWRHFSEQKVTHHTTLAMLIEARREQWQKHQEAEQ